METWLIVAAYVLGFILLQIVLYQYFIRGSRSSSGTAKTAQAESTDGTPGPGHDGSPPAVGASKPVNSESDEELISCGECGAYNRQSQMFVYCRECGEKLD